MSKIVKLSHNQLVNIVETAAKGLIKEDYTFDGFRRLVSLEFEGHRETLDGKRIGRIRPVNNSNSYRGSVTVSFDLEINTKSFGIDSIWIGKLSGPSAIDVIIEIEEEDEDVEYEHTVHIPNWDDFELDYDGENSDFVTTIEHIVIHLDEGFFVKGITVHPFDPTGYNG
jgi:hypothetical protein